MATTYRNERREPVEGDADVVIKVLGLLDVDGGSQADQRRELSRLTESSQADVLRRRSPYVSTDTASLQCEWVLDCYAGRTDGSTSPKFPLMG